MMTSNTRITSIDREKLFTSLVNDIQKLRLQPEDKYEVAALLESFGWNDERVSETFGANDVFELASDLWDSIQNKITFNPYVPLQKISVWGMFVLYYRSFLRGVIFAVPMAISVIAMINLHYSLWSYKNLSTELATSIAIGTILSFMVIGGFMQAIARRGFFYLTQGYYNMGRKIVFIFVKYGYVACSMISIVAFLFNLYFEIFPSQMMLVAVLYFFFLSAIWLSVTIMYILQKEIIFTGLITFGIFLVFVLFELIKIDIIFAQIISLSIVSIIGIILVVYFFIKAERKMEKGIAPALPRMSIALYSVMPYFFYGLLYFSFLFADRIVAWSTNDDYMPYLIWFRGNYELGLDFALLALILPLGFIEVVINKLMVDIESSQKNFSIHQVAKLNGLFSKLFMRRIIEVSLIAVTSSIVLYIAVRLLNASAIDDLSRILDSQVTHFVLIVALISYTIIAVALMNAIILFALSQPEFVIRSIIPGLLTNIVVGFLLSRWLGYHYAIIGLLSGSIVFVVLSTKAVLTVFKNLDFYLYAGS